jgi:hypothetical protein
MIMKRPPEFSCIWVDNVRGEFVMATDSVSDDVSHFVDWIVPLLVDGDRIACIVHLMF